jgi:fibronectin-binding autotransporter adhesin
MATDLAGVSQTFTFQLVGAQTDSTGPYIDNGAAATLTLDIVNSGSSLLEPTDNIHDGSGHLSLTMEGAGQLILSGANAFTGSATIDSGLVSVETSGALGGSNAIVFNNGAAFGALEALANFTTSQTIILQSNSAATLEAKNGHTLTATGYVEIVSGASLHIGSATDTGIVALGASGEAVSLGTSLSLDGGTLQLLTGFSAVLADMTGGVTVNGTLDLDGQSVTLNKLTGAGVIKNRSTTAATLTIDDSGADTFSGSIAGDESLNVAGSGPVVLTGHINVTQATIASGAHLKIGDNTTNSSFSGNVVDNGEFEIDVAGNLTYAQQLSGSGAFELSAASSVITLSGNNSGFSGDIGFDGNGTLSLTNTAALGGAGDLSLGDETVETTVDLTYAGSLDLAGPARLEATAGHTLTFSGYLSDSGTMGSDSGPEVIVGSQVHIGSATDTGTVVLGNNGGPGFSYAGATIEIDGGTLNVQSNLSLKNVAVSFTGTTSKLILNSTTAAVVVSTAAGASGEVDLNSAQVSFTGGGETVKFLTGTSDAATLAGTNGNWDSVYGSNGAVILNGALASILGGDDTVAFAASTSDSASFYNTNYAWDTVNGSSGNVYLTNAQVSIVGGGDTAYLLGTATDYASLYNTNNAWDTINGSNGIVYLTNAQASILGGGDTAYLLGTATDYASLYNTNYAWDTINGSNGIVYLTNAQASILGGGDTANLLGSAADSVSLYNTNNAWDTINGSHGLVILTKAQASVFGGGDTIDFDGSASDYASLYNTGGAADTVNAVNGGVILTSAQASIVGYNDTISMSGASTASETLTNASFHDTYVYQKNMGVSTINGFTTHDAMQLSKADFASVQALFNDMSQSGANTIIRLDANDQITLTNIQKSSLAQSQFSLT